MGLWSAPYSGSLLNNLNHVGYWARPPPVIEPTASRPAAGPSQVEWERCKWAAEEGRCPRTRAPMAACGPRKTQGALRAPGLPPRRSRRGAFTRSSCFAECPARTCIRDGQCPLSRMSYRVPLQEAGVNGYGQRAISRCEMFRKVARISARVFTTFVLFYMRFLPVSCSFCIVYSCMLNFGFLLLAGSSALLPHTLNEQVLPTVLQRCDLRL